MTIDLDRIARQNSAFGSFDDFIAATGDHYSPSIDVSSTERRILADAFDAASERLNKSCKAFRYNEHKYIHYLITYEHPSLGATVEEMYGNRNDLTRMKRAIAEGVGLPQRDLKFKTARV